MGKSAAVAFWMCTLMAAVPADAQRIEAVRVGIGSLELDGRLIEQQWSQALPATGG